jgi:hypothetical protein
MHIYYCSSPFLYDCNLSVIQPTLNPPPHTHTHKEYDQASQWYIDVIKLASAHGEAAVKAAHDYHASGTVDGKVVEFEGGKKAKQMLQAQAQAAQLLQLHSLINLALVRFNTALARDEMEPRERAVLVTQAEQVPHPTSCH